MNYDIELRTLLEDTILGLIMTYDNADFRGKKLLYYHGIDEPQYFGNIFNQHVFLTMQKCWENELPANLINIINFRPDDYRDSENAFDKKGFDLNLITISQKGSFYNSTDFEKKIWVLKQYVIMDYWNTISNNIVFKSWDFRDSLQVSDNILGGYNLLFNKLTKNFVKTESVVEKQKEIFEKKLRGEIITVPSGIPAIDAFTGGWFNGELIITAGRPGMGKCLGKGTKVLMYNGSLKKVEDVIVGDQLMGDDSTPRNVLSLARGKEEMYWIKQKSAMNYRVNKSHILSLKKSRREGLLNKGDILNISVEDYLEKSNKFKSNYKGYKVDVEFNEVKKEIDPYYLGLWLGDGTSASSAITSEDKEIINYLENYANEKKLKFQPMHPKKGCSRYSINGKGKNWTKNCYLNELRKINVLNNKHIPNDYLINSKENRLKLLAGLLDSDGHYQKDFDCFEITQKNKLLSEQILFLCNSLGFKTSYIEKTAKLKSRNYYCQVYRIRISGNLDIIPTLIARKKARKRLIDKDWTVTGIEVEFDKVDDYYGFEIDGNKLFLLEDMTVTHNTTMAIISAIKSAFYHNKKVLFCSLEMPKIQLMNKVAAYQLGLDYHKIKKFEYDKFTMGTVFKFYEFLESEQSNLIITDLKEIATISDINNKIKSIKPNLIIVDYLQLVKLEKGIKTKAGNREQEISYISNSLKQIALMHDIPVMALSQLSRSVEARTNKRPQLSDLRESGSIEQDADIVIFYYRDAYYKELEGKPFPESERWHLEMKFGKGRDLGTKTLYLDANYITYEVTERTSVPPPII